MVLSFVQINCISSSHASLRDKFQLYGPLLQIVGRRRAWCSTLSPNVSWVADSAQPTLCDTTSREVTSYREVCAGVHRAVYLCCIVVGLALCSAGRLLAQSGGLAYESQRGSAGGVLAYNVLLGGLTAATQAIFSGRDPKRAFALGAVGGGVIFAGKVVGSGPGVMSGLAGLAVGTTGISIVSNGGRGAGPLDELFFPLGPLRLRVTPRSSPHMRLTVNAWETASLAYQLSRRGLALDWQRSASSGTFVFVTRYERIVAIPGGEIAGGYALGPLVVISAYAQNSSRVLTHEVVHVQQHWFLQEAWGRPIESVLRERTLGGRWMPAWLELGIVPGAVHEVERRLFGRYAPLRQLRESEAEWFDRR